MKALILSCNTGGGHNAAGKALLEELNRRAIPAAMEDALRFGRRRTSQIVSQGYVNIASHTPRIFGGLYRAGDFISSDKWKSPVYFANTRYAAALHDYIVSQGFDTVFCPHLFPAEALTYARKKYGAPYRLYAVATDYTCIPFMEETEPDCFFIPHADLTAEFVQKGIPQDRLKPLGIPVSQRFADHMTKDEARAELGVDKAARVCLMMTGSMGFGDIFPLPERICAAGADVQVIVLVGSNRELKDRLEEKFGGSGRVRAVSFTDQVPLYMAACDVMLTKPGGLTSTEAAVFSVPLIHTDPIPGCETRNAAFFQGHGMSRRALGGQEIVSAATELLFSDSAREAMRAAQRRTINPYAARDIVDCALERA